MRKPSEFYQLLGVHLLITSLFLPIPRSSLGGSYQMAQCRNNLELTTSAQQTCCVIWHFCRRKKKKKSVTIKKHPWKQPAPELYLIYISSTSQAEDMLSNCRINE